MHILLTEDVSAAAVATEAKKSFFETISAFKIGEISVSSLLSALLTLVICFIIINYKIFISIISKNSIVVSINFDFFFFFFI